MYRPISGVWDPRLSGAPFLLLLFFFQLSIVKKLPNGKLRRFPQKTRVRDGYEGFQFLSFLLAFSSLFLPLLSPWDSETGTKKK